MNGSLLPPTNEVCEGYVFTGVCLPPGGGCVLQGGIHGGGCMAGGIHGRGYAWHGAYMAGGIHDIGHGWWGHVWQGHE